MDDSAAPRSNPSKASLFVGPGLFLGGSWDLVTTQNRAYSPTYSLPKWPYMGYPIRAISPVTSGY